MENKDCLAKQDFYEQYWKCRDFEINNLWQRSIFLGTFLVLSYTAYGAFFGKVFLDGSFDVNLAKWYFHVIACILALIGMAFSVLWIAMAKGSKAWFECYEKAVVAIEKEFVSTPHEKLYSGFGFRYRPFFNGCDLDNSIYSSKGGAYSPSKVNIALGQLSLLIWTGVFAFHAILTIELICLFCQNFCCCHLAIFIVLFVLAILAFILLVTVSGSQKMLGIFDIASKTISAYTNKNENLYLKNIRTLSIFEKILHKVEKECGKVLFDIVENDELYLVILLDGGSYTSLKLDVCAKHEKINLCIKRTNNGEIAENDDFEKTLKTKFKGHLERNCFKIKNSTGSDLFEAEEGIEKVIEIIRTFELC